MIGKFDFSRLNVAALEREGLTQDEIDNIVIALWRRWRGREDYSQLSDRARDVYFRKVRK